MGTAAHPPATPPLAGRPCLVCGTPVLVRVGPWSARCPTCGTWCSDLEPRIESADLHAQIDTDARVSGFKELRVQNNERILDEIDAVLPLAGRRLLDIGCAHGWFLEAAEQRGADAAGIEPEASLTREARERGRSVRNGYFPDVLEPSERADVIAFNDVLEHIPDAGGALAACHATLRPGGILSINIPSAAGAAYRIACALARIGVRGPYARLWQEGLPSPHVHYFTPEALGTLVERHGFRVRTTTALSSIRRDGLWARVHTVSRPTPWSVLSFVGLWLASPVLNRPRNSDIVLVLAERLPDAETARDHSTPE